jgi:hypothetical protein
VLHPDLVPWKIHDSDDEFTAIYEIDGEMVRNGEADGNVIGSREIVDWTWKTCDDTFGPFDEPDTVPEQEPTQETVQEPEPCNCAATSSTQ